jgi:hypothetical protein
VCERRRGSTNGGVTGVKLKCQLESNGVALVWVGTVGWISASRHIQDDGSKLASTGSGVSENNVACNLRFALGARPCLPVQIAHQHESARMWRGRRGPLKDGWGQVTRWPMTVRSCLIYRSCAVALAVSLQPAAWCLGQRFCNAGQRNASHRIYRGLEDGTVATYDWLAGWGDPLC